MRTERLILGDCRRIIEARTEEAEPNESYLTRGLPLPSQSVRRILSLPPTPWQVLGVDLNCSESGGAPSCGGQMARANADHAGAYIDHWNEPTTYRPALCCLIIAHTEQAENSSKFADNRDSKLAEGCKSGRLPSETDAEEGQP